jgi:hypothetical protein
MFVTIRFVARVALDAVVLCLFAGSLAQGQFGPQKHEPKGQWEKDQSHYAFQIYPGGSTAWDSRPADH